MKIRLGEVGECYMSELEKNQSYTINEIEEAYHTKFGCRVKGINLRKNINGNPCIIIFSRERGPYSDEFDGKTLFYDGEGLNQNQKITTANKAIMETNNTGKIIFGFRQKMGDKKDKRWVYIGILKLQNWKLKEKNEFKVYEFELKVQE